MNTLTDEQCEEFRRLPESFNDMVRAIYEAGMATNQAKLGIAVEALEYIGVLYPELGKGMQAAAADALIKIKGS